MTFRRIGILALAFAAMATAIEAIHVALAWWRGSAPRGALEWLALASLPAIAWAWWRFVSPFGRCTNRCLLPDDTRE